MNLHSFRHGFRKQAAGQALQTCLPRRVRFAEHAPGPKPICSYNRDPYGKRRSSNKRRKLYKVDINGQELDGAKLLVPAVAGVALAALLGPFVVGMLGAAMAIGGAVAAGTAFMAFGWLLLPALFALGTFTMLSMGGLAVGLVAGTYLIASLAKLAVVGLGVWLGVTAVNAYMQAGAEPSTSRDRKGRRGSSVADVSIDEDSDDEDNDKDDRKENSRIRDELKDFDRRLFGDRRYDRWDR